VSFHRETMHAVLQALRQRGLWIGTSSWKYPGWLDQLYTPERYLVRGRFSESRFQQECLQEYAEVFPTVSIDASYYRFPDEKTVETLCGQVPEGFLFATKVPDEITVKRFPALPRFGSRAGAVNPTYLNTDLFTERFLQVWEPYREKLGLILFEFSRFHPEDYRRGREFVEDLDRFLDRLPKGWPYGVEIRNQTFLQPEYFEVLRRRGVAHVYNSWTYMPPIGEQFQIPESRTRPDLRAARFLLRPGRKYEEAVQAFQPYREIKDPYPEGRAAGVEWIREAWESPVTGRAFLYVNNRFEGNALQTIAAMVQEALGEGQIRQIVQQYSSQERPGRKTCTPAQLTLPLSTEQRTDRQAEEGRT